MLVLLAFVVLFTPREIVLKSEVEHASCGLAAGRHRTKATVLIVIDCSEHLHLGSLCRSALAERSASSF